MKKAKIYLCVFIFSCFNFISQTITLNSNSDLKKAKNEDLFSEFENRKIDTTLVQDLYHKAKEYRDIDIAKSQYYARRSLEYAKKLNFERVIPLNFLLLADLKRFESNFDSSYYFLNKAEILINANKSSFKNLLYKSLCSAATKIYYASKDLKKSFNYANKGLEISNESKDAAYIINFAMALKEVSIYLGDTMSALKYIHQAERIALLNHDSVSLMSIYSDKGNILFNKNQDTSIIYFKKSLDLSMNLHSPIITCINLNNISEIYFKRKEYDKAHTNIQQAIDLAAKMKYIRLYLDLFPSLLKILIAKEDYKQAMIEGNEYLRLSKETKNQIHLRDALMMLSKISTFNNNYKDAYEYRVAGDRITDSLDNVTNMNSLQDAFTKYETEKKTSEIKLLNKDKETALKEIQRQKQFKLFIALFAALVFAIALIIWFNYRQKSKSNRLLNLQKQQIEQKSDQLQSQNMLLEIKNQLITDSINYAKKMQDSFLPNQKLLANVFSDWFIYYQPKDIVSGDFYWFQKSNNGLIVALADCTGHGVPGALMSVLGHNSLDTAYNQSNSPSPGNVIKYLDNFIKEKTHTDDSITTNVDGMALSLFEYNAQTKKMNYACAKHPIYIVRNKELIELKGNSFSIGSWNGQEITEGEFQLQTNDCIYLFSDGFPDQKGGPEKRKYMYPKFRSLLIEMSDQSMAKQHLAIEEEMNNWKGNVSQMDDILVIGIKI